MHLCSFNHRLKSCSCGLHYSVLRLPERPFLGLVGKADPTPINFTPTFWRGWHLRIIGLFYKLYFNTLNICLRWILVRVRYEQSLEGSTLEGPFEAQCLQPHLRGFQNCWQIFLIVPTWDVLFFPSDIIGGLCSCWWVSYICLLVWRCSLGLFLVPYFPVTTGDPNLLEGLLWPC